MAKMSTEDLLDQFKEMTLLELSERNTPSFMFEIWQRSALTVILKVVPPF